VKGGPDPAAGASLAQSAGLHSQWQPPFPPAFRTSVGQDHSHQLQELCVEPCFDASVCSGNVVLPRLAATRMLLG